MIGKILIVDDEKNLRESLAEAVEAEGFRAEQAADGAEALRKIGEEEFACILLDLRMPRVDGLRVLAMIREGELTDAPVIVISAFGESERTIEAMRLGAFDFLVKPPDIEEITRVLRRAVRQSEANRQRRRREKSSATADDRAPRLIGTSQRMREVFKQIGRVDRCHRFDHGRIGHGQGDDRARHPRPFGARRSTIRRGQLRRLARNFDRSGAVRS